PPPQRKNAPRLTGIGARDSSNGSALYPPMRAQPLGEAQLYLHKIIRAVRRAGAARGCDGKALEHQKRARPRLYSQCRVQQVLVAWRTAAPTPARLDAGKGVARPNIETLPEHDPNRARAVQRQGRPGR